MQKPLVTLGRNRLHSNEAGQAVVEYVLMLVVTVGIVTLIGVGFRKTLFTLWSGFARDIVAACPGCPTDLRRLR